MCIRDSLKDVSKGFPKFNPGVARVTFDIPEPREDVPEDDDANVFRLFLELSSQSPLENRGMSVYIPNASKFLSNGNLDVEFYDVSENGDKVLQEIETVSYTHLTLPTILLV